MTDAPVATLVTWPRASRFIAAAAAAVDAASSIFLTPCYQTCDTFWEIAKCKVKTNTVDPNETEIWTGDNYFECLSVGYLRINNINLQRLFISVTVAC